MAAGGACSQCGCSCVGLRAPACCTAEGRPVRLRQRQEDVRGGAIFLYGDVIYSGGKKCQQALKSHAFQSLVPLLFHLADSCPKVVLVSGPAGRPAGQHPPGGPGSAWGAGEGGPACLWVIQAAQEGNSDWVTGDQGEAATPGGGGSV